MSNSTTLLDTISSTQSAKETTANELFDAHSPSSLFGRRASTTSGLTWGYYGGRMLVDGALTAIANGTVTLTGSTTNYVEATPAGVVSKNTTGFTAGSIPLYTIVVGASSVTSYTDERAWVDPAYLSHKASITIDTADVTLTAAQARCRHIVLSGTLTANRNLIVPNSGEWVVVNNTSGSYTVTVKTSAGTGDTVTHGSSAIAIADGTNVVVVAEPATTPSLALDDLSDVATAGAANGNVLTYNGTSWEPAASSSASLAGLTDVDTTGVSDGEVLTYDNATSKWIPSAAGASPVGKQTIWIPAGSLTSRTTNGAAAGLTESTTNKIMQPSLDFDATTQEFAQFSVAFPKSWDESTVTAQFFWTASTGTGTVVWGLQGVAISDDDALDAEFGTAIEVSDALLATGDLHVTAETSAITIAGTPAAGDICFFQVYRDPADASDSFSADAKLLGIKLYYTTDAVNDA
jgi:hypothetical protein